MDFARLHVEDRQPSTIAHIYIYIYIYISEAIVGYWEFPL